MPTYEYECAACSHRFEAFQGISEPAYKKCPRCRRPKLRRVIGAGAAVIFKGSGFYETDYKRAQTTGKKQERTETTTKDTSDKKKQAASATETSKPAD